MRTVWAWALLLGVTGCARDADVYANPSEGDATAVTASRAVLDEAADPLTATLEEFRRKTERFRDVNVALAEGYVRDPTDVCVTAPFEGFPRQLGVMGLHFFRPDLLGLTAETPRVNGVGTHMDFATPAVLIYVPRADGTLELGAIENLVWEKPWRDAGNQAPPAFEGQEYWRMVDNPLTGDVDEAHGFEPHYELHMWLHMDNPAGVFAPFNPAASCHQHRTTMHH